MVGSLALFAGLVTFDNLTDYETNYAFVRHVLSMDPTPPGNALMYRSHSPPITMKPKNQTRKPRPAATAANPLWHG
jgi:predicted small integral membrane protein